MDANKIATDIRRAIAKGEYAYGEKLPTVREQTERYGVSTQTVSAAYAVLAAMGFVRTDGRSGTRVTAGKSADAHLGDFPPADLSTALPWKPTDGAATGTDKLTLVRRLSAPEYMAAWGIPEGTDVVERVYIRYVDDVPAQYKQTILPYELATARPEGYDGVPPMLLPVGSPPVSPPTGVRRADWLGWDVVGTECSVTADAMPKDVTDALGMAEGSPGFRIVGIAKNSAGGTSYVATTTAPLHHRVTLNIVG